MKKGTTACFIGCDLGDRKSALCHLNAAGVVTRRHELETTRESFTRYFRAIRPAQVVIEVGTHSPWVAAAVQAAGHRALVINPHQFKLLSESRRKSDTNDAELLARAARADLQLLRPVQHRTEKTRSLLAIVRSRDVLVRMRTTLVTHVRGSLKSFGIRCGKCDASTFHERVVPFVPNELKPAIEPVLNQLVSLAEQVKALDARLEELASAHDAYPRLSAIPRVGVLTALTYLLVIENPRRFKKSRDVGAYLGLTPARHQSGEKDPNLGITKAGDGLLRKLLVQCGHQLLFKNAPDCALSRVGKQLMKEGKPRNVAAVAVARKLAGLMHLLWVKKTDFQPFPS